MMIYGSEDISADLNASNNSFTTTEKINRETYTVKLTYVHKIDLEDLKKTDPLVNKSEAVQALNIIFKSILQQMKFCEIGQNS